MHLIVRAVQTGEFIAGGKYSDYVLTGFQSQAAKFATREWAGVAVSIICNEYFSSPEYFEIVEEGGVKVMPVKQKIAEIIAARDNLPVDCVLNQLDQMLGEMVEAAEGDDWGGFAHDVEDIWTDWTGLEPDYFMDFVLENL